MKKTLFTIMANLLLLSTVFCSEKVLILTSAYNRADFIEWQHLTFSKLLKDEYEFIVFSDASDPKHIKEIHDVCQKYNIQCIDVPMEIHLRPYLDRLPGESLVHPAVRNCNVVQYALNTVGFKHKGIVAIFDSDMFLVKECSFNEIMEGYDILAVPQGKSHNGIGINYLWIGLCLLNSTKLNNFHTLNFNCGRIQNVPVDSGGHSYYYLKAEKPNVFYMNRHAEPYVVCPEGCYPLYDCEHVNEKFAKSEFDLAQEHLLRKGLPSGEFFHDTCFFHYRGGSNWDYQPDSFHKSKSVLIQEYIDEVLASD